jgi:hypothetical protein
MSLVGALKYTCPGQWCISIDDEDVSFLDSS